MPYSAVLYLSMIQCSKSFVKRVDPMLGALIINKCVCNTMQTDTCFNKLTTEKIYNVYLYKMYI